MTNGVDGAGEKIGLPPCGGSGLKCAGNESCERNREVSLHAEGVD